jgi:hypothetical protein
MAFYQLQSGRWVNLGRVVMVDGKHNDLHVYFANDEKPLIVSDPIDVDAIYSYLAKNQSHPDEPNSD